MRIVAGKYGGRRIGVPSGSDLRPTSERVREAIFSSLTSHRDFENLRVLDLYAGSGALGFEALSRGAASVVFVESDKDSCKQIQDTAKLFGAERQTKVVQAKVLDSLKRMGEAAFDLVFADPPYADHPGEELVTALGISGMVAPGTSIVIEGGAKLKISPVVELLSKDLQANGLIARLDREKRYGDTVVFYLEVEHRGEGVAEGLE